MKKLMWAALLGATCCAGEAVAQQQAKAERAAMPRYTARQFFETTTFSLSAPTGIGFSRDGRHVLVSSDRTGVINGFALPLDGGDSVPLSSSTTHATYAVSYFPDGERVLLTSDQGGNELNHLYVRAADGAVRDLTPGEKLKAGFLGWSTDGRTFYVSTNERDPANIDLYAYDASTYDRRLIFKNDGFSIGAVSPDGRHVALTKAISSARSEVYLARVGSGAPRLISPQGKITHEVFGFTPDGSAVIYGSDQGREFAQAVRYDIASGKRRPMITADWDVMFVTHSPSGRYRVHGINQDASTRLTITDSRTGRPVRLTGVPAGNITDVRFNQDETRIAFAVEGSTSPTDIFVAHLVNGRSRRLTNALGPAVSQGQLIQGRVARFRSYDGLHVPGILYRPREASAANPVPAVVYVHGGPGGQARLNYNPVIQHLVNHGYAVFRINNRGSSGYGKTFFHMDDKKHGDADLRDVVASRVWLAGQDWISNRVAVMGASYGGYMTAAALAFHPEVFDAGVNIFGVTNWTRTLTSMPSWWAARRVALYDELGDPATDADRHQRISPLFHAAKIRRPLLVVQGANDPRVLQVESDELVAAVRRNNVPAEYVLFPDEGHGFRRRENRITASEAYLRFLNQHLRR